MSTKNIFKGELNNIPPRILGEPPRLFRRTIGEIIGLGLGVFVDLFYLLVIPFPEAFSLRLIIALGLYLSVAGFLVISFGGRTALGWSIAYLSFTSDKVPRHTRARFQTMRSRPPSEAVTDSSSISVKKSQPSYSPR